MKYDWLLCVFILILIILGLIVHSGFDNFSRQLTFSILGLVLFFLISFIDWRYFKTFAWFFYFFSIILLVAVLFFGETFRGVRGWFYFKGISFQPVELVKFTVILALSRYWSKKGAIISWPKIIGSFFLIVPAIFLVGIQPDIGSSLIILSIGIGFILLVDRNPKRIFCLGLILLVLIAGLWFFILENYQKDRLISYFNPKSDPLGRGWQIAQSIIAVGSGQFFGRGIGAGTQSQLKFLPAAQTDFVFAVLAEEMGLIGVILLFGFFFLLFRRLIKIAKILSDDFASLFVLGITFNLFFQFILNIGMNVGFLPIIGIPLPLISYGGSSLVANLISLGAIEGIIKKQPREKEIIDY